MRPSSRFFLFLFLLFGSTGILLSGFPLPPTSSSSPTPGPLLPHIRSFTLLPTAPFPSHFSCTCLVPTSLVHLRSLFLALKLFSFARYARYAPCSFADKELSDLDEVIGGSAWGAATVAAGDGSRQPTARELAIAKNQGKRFAETVATFVRGKQ